MSIFLEARREFHAILFDRGVLSVNERNIPSNADSSSNHSIRIARGIINRIGQSRESDRLAGQTAGNTFEAICEHYISRTFLMLTHLRPGNWHIRGQGSNTKIAQFEQYAHLDDFEKLCKDNLLLSATFGSEHLITPDIIIIRDAYDDDIINANAELVDNSCAVRAALRRINNPQPILHASISCKWTMRSDRAQNSRSEALNMIRNRKGRLPHIVVVTGEPAPGRLASIAMGTGDIDCVYHFALPELIESVEESGTAKAKKSLATMTQGKRLRDISDLPLDLVI